MKNAFLLMVCLQLFSGNQALPELLKLPQLVEHFQEHRATEPTISFAQFLWLHYSNNTHSEATHHDNLPFKHCDDCCPHHRGAVAASDFFILNGPEFLENQALALAQSSEKPLGERSFCPRLAERSIFQPPRLS